jgi:hypothetical protein
MRIQTLLTAAVLNLKKLLKAISRKPAQASQTAVPSARSPYPDLLWLILGHRLQPALANVNAWTKQSEPTRRTDFGNRPLRGNDMSDG